MHRTKGVGCVNMLRREIAMVFAIVIAGMLGASSPGAAVLNDVGRPPLAPPAEYLAPG
jgi:hypothetical protein